MIGHWKNISTCDAYVCEPDLLVRVAIVLKAIVVGINPYVVVCIST